MSANLLVLLVATMAGAQPSPFDSKDPAQRLEAARQHREAHGPAVTAQSWGKHECRWFRAPAGSACKERVQLCRGMASSGMCDGSYHEWQWAYPSYAGEPEANFVRGTGMGDGIPLLDEAGLDEGGVEMQAFSECQVHGFGCVGAAVPVGATDEQRAKLEQEARKRCEEARQNLAEEQRRCTERLRKQAAKEKSELKCELVAVQPCFNEAFVRCRAKRMEPEGIPLNRVFRASWKRGKDVRARETLKLGKAARQAE